MSVLSVIVQVLIVAVLLVALAGAVWQVYNQRLATRLLRAEMRARAIERERREQFMADLRYQRMASRRGRGA